MTATNHDGHMDMLCGRHGIGSYAVVGSLAVAVTVTAHDAVSSLCRRRATPYSFF